jgi:hypothetical protein
VREVQQFWEDYERALVADRRYIQMRVVRSAVAAIAALEAEVKELQQELEREEEYASGLHEKITQYNPNHWQEE